MVHSESIPGLLPRYSSWSLCAIGKYSDYSAYNGLTQPGFLSGHNFLIPWDIYSHSDRVDKRRSKLYNVSKKPMKGKMQSFFVQFGIL